MTAEVRLVDADELRRRYISEGYAPLGEVVRMLDAMPSSTAPKGWTRDEVLAALAEHPDNVCEWLRPIGGDWVRYFGPVEQWHPEVRRYDVRVVRSTPDPEWVPLTKLVGRTIHGCDVAVNRVEVYRSPPSWWAIHDIIFDARAFPDGTLNLDDATVAVRPEAAT